MIRRSVFLRSLVFGLLAGSLTCQAQTQGLPPPPSTLPSPAAKSAEAAGAAGTATKQPFNAMVAAARNVGVARCLPALNRMSSLALQSAVTHDVLLDWDRQAPDRSPFFGLMGVTNGATGTFVNTYVLMPDGDTCTVMAERIAWAPEACPQVARQELPNYQVTPLLPGMAVLTNPQDAGSSVSLIDAGQGCIVLRRFVQYRWKTGASVDVSPAVNGGRR